MKRANHLDWHVIRLMERPAKCLTETFGLRVEGPRKSKIKPSNIRLWSRYIGCLRVPIDLATAEKKKSLDLVSPSKHEQSAQCVGVSIQCAHRVFDESARCSGRSRMDNKIKWTCYFKWLTNVLNYEADVFTPHEVC